MTGSNKPIVAAAAVIVLGISVVLIVRGGSSSHAAASQGVYFYDLTSGALFTAPIGATPPLDAPSGAGQGVKAFVVGCGSCDAANLRVLRLETLTDEAVAALAEMKANSGPPSDALIAGQRVAVPPDKTGAQPAWVPQGSPRGRAILARMPDKVCDSTPATICTP